jgi:hypothetical protein
MDDEKNPECMADVCFCLRQIHETNQKILKKQAYFETCIVAIKRKTDLAFDVIDSLTKIFQTLSSVKGDIRKALSELKKPVQIYKPKQHLIERQSLSDQEPGILPATDLFLDLVHTALKKNNTEKFYTPLQVPFEDQQHYQKSFNNSKKPAYPAAFSHFLRRFLEIPSNCCFFRKNDRCYVNRSSNDRWEKVETNQDFWCDIKSYLWGNYVRFLEKISDQVIDFQTTYQRVEDLEYPPVNKAGLIYLLFKHKIPGNHLRLCDHLESAYRSRNKSH